MISDRKKKDKIDYFVFNTANASFLRVLVYDYLTNRGNLGS